MEQVNNNLTKIILFCDDNKLRRLQAGYYGESKDWNPNGEITLKRIKDIEDMANQGVKFEQTPSIKEENTVFVEVEPKHYACIQEYAPSLIKNKQKALASVLQKLGIHEYFIKSEFNLDSGSDVKIGGENQCGGLKASIAKIDAEYQKCKGVARINQKDWEDAKLLAMHANLYNKFEDIINMRNPKSENTLLKKEVYKEIAGEISANINVAKALETIEPSSGIIAEGLFRQVSIDSFIKGQYKTHVVYNFDPNVNDNLYKKLVDEEESGKKFENN